MATTDSPTMRTSDVLRALADQLDALGDVLDHPITATVYDFGYKHEVAIQPFGDDDQRDIALTYALADALGAEINVRTLDKTKVSVQFATTFSGVELSMFAHVARAVAERVAYKADRPTLAEQLRRCGAEQAARDAEADAFHAQRRADEAEANGEYVDYDEADAVREIEREMAIEAGDDSEIDRQVAEDDARFERSMWLANQATRDAESEAGR